jgi:hypothetical protein
MGESSHANDFACADINDPPPPIPLRFRNGLTRDPRTAAVSRTSRFLTL